MKNKLFISAIIVFAMIILSNTLMAVMYKYVVSSTPDVNYNGLYDSEEADYVKLYFSADSNESQVSLILSQKEYKNLIEAYAKTAKGEYVSDARKNGTDTGVYYISYGYIERAVLCANKHSVVDILALRGEAITKEVDDFIASHKIKIMTQADDYRLKNEETFKHYKDSSKKKTESVKRQVLTKAYEKKGKEEIKYYTLKLVYDNLEVDPPKDHFERINFYLIDESIGGTHLAYYRESEYRCIQLARLRIFIPQYLAHKIEIKEQSLSKTFYYYYNYTYNSHNYNIYTYTVNMIEDIASDSPTSAATIEQEIELIARRINTYLTEYNNYTNILYEIKNKCDAYPEPAGEPELSGLGCEDIYYESSSGNGQSGSADLDVPVGGSVCTEGWWKCAWSFLNYGGSEDNESNQFGIDDVGAISELRDLIFDIGNVIFILVTAYLGVKYIWGGVDSKFTVKNSLMTLVVAAIVFYGWNAVTDILNVEQLLTGSDAAAGETNMVNIIYNTILYVINIAAVGGIIFIGIKYMLAGAEGRSELKLRAIPVVMGVIMVYGTINLITVVLKIVDAL